MDDKKINSKCSLLFGCFLFLDPPISDYLEVMLLRGSMLNVASSL